MDWLQQFGAKDLHNFIPEKKLNNNFMKNIAVLFLMCNTFYM